MNKITSAIFAVLALSVSCIQASFANKATPLNNLTELPVKEVTVFKDGHSFLVHRGSMPTRDDGSIVMDYLPAPVFGTFWPFCADKSARLDSVVASQHKVLVPNTSLSVAELIEGNPGAQAAVTILSGDGENAKEISFDATILEVPQRSSEELEKISPPNSGEHLPIKGDLVLLKTASGTQAIPLSRIRAVAFKSGFDKSVCHEEFRNLIVMNLDWTQSKPNKSADVGLMYLQQGIRWVPNYKVTIDGKGKATVTLQATLVNDLLDLKDVDMNLVIGVPTFAFKNQVDPISLQNIISQVASYSRRDSQMSQLSNSIMAQGADNGTVGGAAYSYDAVAESSAPSISTPVTGASKSEDLFVFSVKHVNLKKGQRMVLPVESYTVNYEDLYTLELPFTPPPEVPRSGYSSASNEVDQLQKNPIVMHKLRLTNNAKHPFTTAPALLVRHEDDVDRVISQGVMTYTAPGGKADLTLTSAVDIKVKKSESESGRVSNATRWQGYDYGKVNLSGTVSLQNLGVKPVNIEITRNLLGWADSASDESNISQINLFEEGLGPGGSATYPGWWNWYSWPTWWHHLNGAAKIKWTVKLAPKEKSDLTYKWHYFWR